MIKLKYILSKIIKKLHFPAIINSKLNATSRVCSFSHVTNTKIGKFSYIGNNCIVVNANIGSFCSVADNCVIGGSSHPIYWVSTSPVFHEGKNILKKNFSNHKFDVSIKTIIGNDVWIGINSIIKSGVVIGDGAIIGMGSVVTKNIGPYEIWAGNPAKLIKNRFDELTKKELIDSKWWLLSEDMLISYAENFNNTKQFIKGIKRI